MSCLQCGTETKTGRENFLYISCGLPNVTLVGVEVSRCPKCGEFEVTIPKIEELHRTIAAAVAKKAFRLTQHEIRFLRKWLGWSGVDFAAHMGVAPETVSRWENGNLQMGGPAERLLRLMVAKQNPVEAYPLELFKSIEDQGTTPIRLGVAADDRGWHLEAA